MNKEFNIEKLRAGIKLFYCLIFFIVIKTSSNKAFSQTIHNVWYSEESNSCIEFDSITGRMNMGLLHDNYKEGKQRMEYKIIDSKLKVNWYFNQTFFGYQKWVSWFEINELTENHLTLTLLNPEDNNILEFFGGVKIRFNKANYPSCDSVYEK